MSEEASHPPPGSMRLVRLVRPDGQTLRVEILGGPQDGTVIEREFPTVSDTDVRILMAAALHDWALVVMPHMGHWIVETRGTGEGEHEPIITGLGETLEEAAAEWNALYTAWREAEP